MTSPEDIPVSLLGTIAKDRLENGYKKPEVRTIAHLILYLCMPIIFFETCIKRIPQISISNLLKVMYLLILRKQMIF